MTFTKIKINVLPKIKITHDLDEKKAEILAATQARARSACAQLGVGGY